MAADAAHMKTILAIILLLIPFEAAAQSWAPPFCTGPNRALQYNQQGWLCVTLTVTQTPLPAQPPPSQCITSHWDGTKWNCVPTENLTR